MEIAQALEFAKSKLVEHCILDWKIELSRAKRTLGLCKYSSKTILLSKIYVTMNSEELVYDTILHEIAHALCGAGHGHDRVWRNMCVKIGAKPKRCKSIKDGLIVEYKYSYKCSKCGIILGSHRPYRNHVLMFHKGCKGSSIILVK